MKQFFLFLIIGFILCGAINAQINYGIEIAGTEINNYNYYAINNVNFPNLGLTSGTITYDREAKTFTLNEVNAKVTSAHFMWFRDYAADGEYKIVLSGNSVITDNANSCLYICRNVTIEGDGSLKLTSTSTIGINIGSNSTLTIKNTTVEVMGVYGGIKGLDGISSENLKIENSIVKVNSTNEGSIFKLASIDHTGCVITKPVGAAVAANGSDGQAVMLNGEIVKSEVIIEPIGNYGIKIAGKDLSSLNVGAINNENFPNLGLTSGTISYDHTIKTFILDGVNANIANSSFIEFTNTAVAAEYKIILIGNNVVNSYIYSITTFRNLTIEGDGSLKITSNTSCGLHIAYNGMLTLKNTTVEAKGPWGIAGSNGTSNETLIIENSNVRATGTVGSICDLNTITLTNCAITKPEGAIINTNGSNGQAVMLNGNVVKTEVVIEPIVSYNIYIAETKLTNANAWAINNDNFPNLGLTSGTITYSHSAKTITLNGVNANITKDYIKFIDISNNAKDTVYKINLIGDNVIGSGSATIFTYQDLIINGNGSLKVTSDYNCGINAIKTLSIENTTVEAIGGWGFSGIDGNSGETLIIENSNVKVTGSNGGSIRNFQTITLINCEITQPEGAEVADNGTSGQAVMLNGNVVKTEVVIEPIAITKYGIYIAGTELTSANVDNINNDKFSNLGLETGSISYDHNTKTFTLNELSANVNSNYFIYITESAEDVEYKINLIGYTHISASTLRTARNLIIEGGDSLKIITSSNEGIFVDVNATLTIKNTTVEADAAWGIVGYDGTKGENLIIEKSTVRATGNSGSIGYFQSITLIDCEITQPEGAVIGTYSTSGQAVMLGGYIVTSEVVIEPKTGINNFSSEAAFSIYPNPANNILNIISENANELITISDISGKIVYSEKTSDKQSSINISQLSAGMYIIRIGSKTAKFVKE